MWGQVRLAYRGALTPLAFRPLCVVTILVFSLATTTRSEEVPLPPIGASIAGEQVAEALLALGPRDVLVADSVTVIGTLHTSWLDTVHGEVRFRGVRFSGPVLMGGTSFLRGADFHASTFLDTAIFSGVRFHGAATSGAPHSANSPGSSPAIS